MTHISLSQKLENSSNSDGNLCDPGQTILQQKKKSLSNTF
jgi:hypothetical protein